MKKHQYFQAAPTDSSCGVAIENDPAFWQSLINEAEAARFLGFSVRHVQGLRYRGGGPAFIKISSRCVRYRRADLRQWAEARLRTSTSDVGSEAAAMTAALPEIRK